MKCLISTNRQLRLIAISLVLTTSGVYAQQALVRSYDQNALNIGQAYLARYSDECLALLPTHVANEANNHPSLLGSGNKPLLGETLDIVDLGDDLSVATVSGALNRKCGSSMGTLSRAVDKHVQKTGIGTLRSVNSDGTVANVSVAIVDNDGQAFLRIQPTNSEQQIRKGQSGSLLIANAQPVGMLLSVSSRRGIGKVIRFDTLLDRVEKHKRGRQQHKAGSSRKNPAANNGDLASSANGGAVVAWSASAIDSDHRPANLVADKAASSWQVKAEKWPVEVELDLAGERNIINQIIMVSQKDIEPSYLPNQVEVYINISSDEQRWRALTTRQLSFDEDGQASLVFAPTWARQIKLSFGRTKAGKNIINLSRIHVFGP